MGGKGLKYVVRYIIIQSSDNLNVYICKFFISVFGYQVDKLIHVKPCNSVDTIVSFSASLFMLIL